MKRINNHIAAIVNVCSIILMVISVTACDPDGKAPERLPNIPQEAVWVGGADGGAWVWCKKDGARNWCAIYNENTGEIWTSGYYVLEGSDQGVSMRELRYDFFDGERIGLSDGRLLIPSRRGK